MHKLAELRTLGLFISVSVRDWVLMMLRWTRWDANSVDFEKARVTEDGETAAQGSTGSPAGTKSPPFKHPEPAILHAWEAQLTIYVQNRDKDRTSSDQARISLHQNNKLD